MSQFEEALKDAPPWLAADVPNGYTLGEDGVWFEPAPASNGKSKPPEHITREPAWVSAFTRTSANESWGAVVCWLDRDKHMHERAIPVSKFHEKGNTLAQELAAGGLPIVAGRESKLFNYFGSFKTDARQLCVHKLGWLDTADGSLIYVTPTRSLRRIPDGRSDFPA